MQQIYKSNLMQNVNTQLYTKPIREEIKVCPNPFHNVSAMQLLLRKEENQVQLEIIFFIILTKVASLTRREENLI